MALSAGRRSMCWKLVRDRIGEELRERGVVVWRARSDEEYLRALAAKVVEEAFELVEAVWSGDRGRVVEEAADLLEALYALLGVMGVGVDVVEEARVAKRREKGGFDKRLLALVDCGDGGAGSVVQRG